MQWDRCREERDAMTEPSEEALAAARDCFGTPQGEVVIGILALKLDAFAAAAVARVLARLADDDVVAEVGFVMRTTEGALVDLIARTVLARVREMLGRP